MKVSIIIPAHNEEKRIEKTLKEYVQFFNKSMKGNYEIWVILNGCKDDTLRMTKKIAQKFKTIKYKNYVGSGKGFAILEGFKEALTNKSDLIGFVDADMATSPVSFYNLIKNINKYDGIIASRYVKGAIVKPKQSIPRTIASRIFNFLVRVLFLMPYHDTQCGAKVFRRDALKRILPKITTSNWAFDVDLLYRSKKFGLNVIEYPTVWEDKKDSKLNLRKASIQMFFAIIRLKLLNSKFKRIWWIFKPFSGWIWRLVR